MAPKSRGQHHAQKDDGCDKCLLVSSDAPVTMECGSENTKDGHFHAVRHPTETYAKGELDLEPAEAKGVDGLSDGECV